MFPEIHTERLLLKQVLQADAATVLKGYSDVRINQFMSVAYHSLEEVQAQLNWYNELYQNKTGIWWGICLKSTGEMIGNTGYHLWNHNHRSAEIGYWILPEFQRQGYALETLQGVVQYGFDHMHLHRIEAQVENENSASSTLLLKAGFHLDGIKRECEFIQERFISLEIWSKLSTDGS